MKRWMFFAAPVTVALILGLVVYALPASGSSTSLISRVAKLEAQTKALKAQNTRLAKRVTTLEAFAGCLNQITGLTQWGNQAHPQGYLFTEDGTTTILTSALDYPAQGQAPDILLPQVNPSCVSQSRSIKTGSHSRYRYVAHFKLPR